jgi:heterodisulfide reductase subunit A2
MSENKTAGNEDRKIGVFICQCGGNISDYVDTEQLRAALEKESMVSVSEVNMFTCSDAAQQNIIEKIRSSHLDGLVVASCSPKLHLNTFRAMAKRAGLNEYQYVQANIREQCSWAHTHDRPSATEKAIRIVRSGVAKASLSRPLKRLRIETLPSALVVGAGVAGLRAALALSDIGISVHLVEKAAKPGGRVEQWGHLFPNDRNGSQVIRSLLEKLRTRENIVLYPDAELIEKEGTVGAFSLKVRVKEEIISLSAGSIIVATGFDPYAPEQGEFGYGLNGVLTLPEYEELLASTQGRLSYKGKEVGAVTYIYCVGSRQNYKDVNPNLYCSRYCCSAASHAALCSCNSNKAMRQYHLFRDIRTYGKYELLYKQALDQGSLYLRYDESSLPVVSHENGTLKVRLKDKLSGGEEVELQSDLVVLVTGMVPRENSALNDVLKLPVGKDRFFNEVHPKLRPVETMVDGVFIAGAAQGPKNMAESVASAMAAVSKTAALLLKGYVDLEPLVAKVEVDLCVWCGECAKVCAFNAIEKVIANDKEVARVNEVVCKGAGTCVAVCPRQAISVEGYSNKQITRMIEALAREVTHEEKRPAELVGGPAR